MKRLVYALVLFAFAIAVSSTSPAQAATFSGVIPTFSITSIVKDTSITIKTYNFPAHKNFDALMGYMGTRGVNGIKVATVNSGSGGSFTATLTIPNALKGLKQIAVQLQVTDGSGYFAYNWFYNNTGGGIVPPGGGSSNIPTFMIAGVVQDLSVTITTHNFPKNDSFDVLMNYMGTRGKNGIKVATVSSGAGGTLTFTFHIPDALKGLYQIAIRLQSNTGSGYFAYNWFYNNTAGSTGGSGGTPGYGGFPTFSITGVVRNQTVSIATFNLPPSDTFKVLMGPMGTRGIHGFYVTTFDSGTGGAKTFTFKIPPELYGSHQIAIRLQSTTGSGYYAYNWFYNNTTP